MAINNFNPTKATYVHDCISTHYKFYEKKLLTNGTKILKSGKKWEIVGKFQLSLHQIMANDLFIIGTHECKIDSKGRVMLPLGLKKQLMSVLSDGFVIKRSVFHNCLELYPKQEWDKEIAGINKLNRFVKKNVEFIRRFMAGVKIVELDGQDRFLIPKDLTDFANLHKNLVLSSAVNRIEVWDKNQYEENLNDETIEFGALAEDVMGNIQPEE